MSNREKSYPLRSSQLIAPFGPGAMFVTQDGMSLIACGLDHWYERENGQLRVDSPEVKEFMFSEWRLQDKLNVGHFRLPPDYRDPQRISGNTPNSNLTVPYLKFPTWHVCKNRNCQHLDQARLLNQGRFRCKLCGTAMVQVRFIALCDQGHIQDFPWREWAHGSARPDCNKALMLQTTGVPSLSGIKVVCDCGKSRPLTGIMCSGDSTNSSFLSDTLDRETKEPFTCGGHRPWLGNQRPVTCTRPLRGALRGASNVYFARVATAIYLPQQGSNINAKLLELLNSPEFRPDIRNYAKTSNDIESAADTWSGILKRLPAFHSFSSDDIKEGIRFICSGDQPSDGTDEPEEDREVAFRRAEYNVLRENTDEDDLKIGHEPFTDYHPEIRKYFSRIMLSPRLRETRALVGFTRLVPENSISQSVERMKDMLWINRPRGNDEWLPAYKVFGEGIFLELDETRLSEWENEDFPRLRISRLEERYNRLRQEKGLEPFSVTPRFVLLHTLSHLIMNQLTFECGYSSSSLRERIYCSSDAQNPMAGILIYTASGDSEGTLGGLVRMGRPGMLEPVIIRALEKARWCSTDPICMEIGGTSGQGPDSCNLAACHNCGLVPETACEEFNRFLDRGTVIGNLNNPDQLEAGFFKQFSEKMEFASI